MVSELKNVQAGQKVDLKALENGYQLTVLAADQPGHTVTEVGPDYVVIDDTTEGVLRRVPVYLIFSVTTAAAPAAEPAPQAA